MSAQEGKGKYREGKSEEAMALTAGDASFQGDSTGPGSASSTRGTTSTEAEDELHDGCIVLGKDAGMGNRYSENKVTNLLSSRIKMPEQAKIRKSQGFSLKARSHRAKAKKIKEKRRQTSKRIFFFGFSQCEWTFTLGSRYVILKICLLKHHQSGHI